MIGSGGEESMVVERKGEGRGECEWAMESSEVEGKKGDGGK